MPIVKCKICDSVFSVKPSHQKLGYGKYCSMACRRQGQRKGKFVICEICGAETWKQPKALRNSKSKKFFCGKKCQTIWRNKHYSGKRHFFWRGGEHTYRRIMLSSGQKQICKKCGIDDKRVLVVHHKDCNRKNNVPDNLVWLCCNCHYLIHNHGVTI